MASANDKLLNESIGHAIDLHGYSNNVSAKMLKLLNQVDADLMQQITVAVDSLPSNKFNIDRLEKILKDVRALNSEVYANVSTSLNKELTDLTAYEIGYQTRLINDVLPDSVEVSSITPNKVYAAAMDTPFSGKLLTEFMAGMEIKRMESIRDAIRMGYLESQTTSDIVKRIRGTKALNYADGLLQISRRDAESIVITAVSHTSSFARDALYQANSDIIKAYRYTATLDLRTTELCASRDGNEYKIGSAKPAIPAHIRCRSLYVPVLKSWKDLGIDLNEIPASTRASLDGQVPAKISYQEWLLKQTAERQNTVLGLEKAQLFRDGKLTLDKFVSPVGHSYSMAELKALHPDAFVSGVAKKVK